MVHRYLLLFLSLAKLLSDFSCYPNLFFFDIFGNRKRIVFMQLRTILNKSDWKGKYIKKI